jgi:Na+-translocating ferredoxin:NAD+ oxidoreductase RnfA subunit
MACTEWNTNGGVEWPLMLATVAFVVALIWPGLYSLYHMLGIVLPEPTTYLAVLAAMLIIVGAALIPHRAASVHALRFF